MILNYRKNRVLLKQLPAKTGLVQHFVNCIAVSVQVVASDSRMIVFVLADGQSPAIRNDNLQFSVGGNLKKDS